MIKIATIIERDKDYSAREVGEWLSMRHLEVIRRLRKGDIKGRKIGWIWAVTGRDIVAAMKSDWYKKSKRTN